jgi:hypothetical protein
MTSVPAMGTLVTGLVDRIGRLGAILAVEDGWDHLSAYEGSDLRLHARGDLCGPLIEAEDDIAAVGRPGEAIQLGLSLLAALPRIGTGPDGVGG